MMKFSVPREIRKSNMAEVFTFSSQNIWVGKFPLDVEVRADLDDVVDGGRLADEMMWKLRWNSTHKLV